MQPTLEDDASLALPWLSEREPGMLMPEALPPSDAFDGLLSQWLMSAVQPGLARCAKLQPKHIHGRAALVDGRAWLTPGVIAE